MVNIFLKHFFLNFAPKTFHGHINKLQDLLPLPTRSPSLLPSSTLPHLRSSPATRVPFLSFSPLSHASSSTTSSWTLHTSTPFPAPQWCVSTLSRCPLKKLASTSSLTPRRLRLTSSGQLKPSPTFTLPLAQPLSINCAPLRPLSCPTGTTPTPSPPTAQALRPPPQPLSSVALHATLMKPSATLLSCRRLVRGFPPSPIP